MRKSVSKQSGAPFKTERHRPTRAELLGAVAKTVPDLNAPGLKILFAGINPGLYSAAIGRHFGRPGNRFWPALHAGGLTSRLLSPYEEEELLALGYGITNIVKRATAAADELSAEELRAGARRLAAKVSRYRPTIVAILGVQAYRLAFGRPKAAVGPQAETLSGVRVWVLPNPSGINAHFLPRDLARIFAELKADSESPVAGGPAERRGPA
jgi:TDG/mug DNA glycosylase family protein